MNLMTFPLSLAGLRDHTGVDGSLSAERADRAGHGRLRLLRRHLGGARLPPLRLDGRGRRGTLGGRFPEGIIMTFAKFRQAVPM